MVPTVAMREFVDGGVYTLPEAARLLRSQRATVQRWAFGYRRGGKSYPPVIDAHLPDVDGRHAVTFLELVELFTIREFRSVKVPWHKIRATFDYLSGALETRHPFALKRWFVDKAGIYYQVEAGGPFIEASGDGQLAIKAALTPYLRQLEFDLEGIARRWFPLGKEAPVVIDPGIAFGAPVVAGTGIRTATLAAMEKAGESPESIAWWYELEIPQVDAALRYERSLAA